MEDAKTKRTKIKDKKIFGIPIRIILTIIIILLIFLLVREIISDTESISRIAKSAGAWGPIVLIFLISLAVLFTPIPSFILIITAGYLYGTWGGALYSYIGHLLAAIGTFSTMKIFKIKHEGKTYQKYKSKIQKNKKIIYLLYASSILPVSIISILTEASKIKWKEFLKMIFISFLIPSIILSLIGDSINGNDLINVEIIVVAFVVLLIFLIKILEKKKIFHKIRNKTILKKFFND